MSSNSPLPLRHLGQTEVQVTPIGLGTMQLAGGRFPFNFAFKQLSQADANAIIRAALDGGINWFDTAELYGFGRSERVLSRALQVNREAADSVVIATKWFPILRTARNIGRTIRHRLEALSPFPIDLYMVHQPWSFSSPEEEMDAMAELVAAGKIKTVGVSNFDARRMERAHRALEKHGLTLAVNQLPYSLMNRGIEQNEVLQLAKDLGVTIIAYTPLEYGLLTGKLHHDPTLLQGKTFIHRRELRASLERTRPLIEKMRTIAARYQTENGPASVAQVALNWVIHYHGDTVVTIPGASKPEHAVESSGALHFTLSQDDLDQLADLSARITN